MLRKISLCLLGVFFAQPFCAQSSYSKHSFSAYSAFVRKALDMEWKFPKGFVDLKQLEAWGPEGVKGVGYSYGPILQSENEECILMYPKLLIAPQENRGAIFPTIRSQAEGEVKAALRIKGTESFEFVAPYFSILDDEKVLEKVNADTILVVQIPIKTPYRSKYSYCTAVNMYKKGRPILFFKLFFTEEGKAKEADYLGRFYQTVRFRKDNWIYDAEKYSREGYELYLKTK